MNAHDQIAEANRMLLKLEQQKADIQEQINAWTQIRDGYGKLAETSSEPDKLKKDMGLTDAIRVILRKYPEGLTSTEIRDKLLAYGVLSGKTRLIVNVHTILARLCEKTKEVEQVNVNGRIGYRWITAQQK